MDRFFGIRSEKFYPKTRENCDGALVLFASTYWPVAISMICASHECYSFCRHLKHIRTDWFGNFTLVFVCRKCMRVCVCVFMIKVKWISCFLFYKSTSLPYSHRLGSVKVPSYLQAKEVCFSTWASRTHREKLFQSTARGFSHLQRGGGFPPRREDLPRPQ